MIEHLVPVYTLTASLLAEPLRRESTTHFKRKGSAATMRKHIA